MTTTRKQSSASHEGKPCVDTTPIGTAGPMRPATLQGAIREIERLEDRTPNPPSQDEE